MKNSKPVVSVVIPAFNAAATIRETLDSVLEQRGSLEVIVVNDGSTDATAEVLAEYGGKIRVLEQSNSGISVSRNNGAKAAFGEIVAFLDSDVTVEEGWLGKLLEGFSAQGVFAVSGKVLGKSNGSLSSDFFQFTIGSSSFQGYNVAFRRKEFLGFAGFNEGMKYCEDPELAWRIFEAGKKTLLVDAKAFHRAYSFRERFWLHKRYAFFDARLFRKALPNLLSDPVRFLKETPSNLKFIFGFYFAVLLAAVFTAAALLSGLTFLFAGAFTPSILASANLLSKRKRFKTRHSFFAVLVSGFAITALFAAVKTLGFVQGLLWGEGQ